MTMATVVLQTRRRLRRTPLLTTALALAVTAAMALPPLYLLLRAVGEGGAIVDALTASSTARALGRTVLLTAAVTVSCAVIAAPLAWCTERTDLPLSSLWRVLLALPLAIPSFIGGYTVVSAFGPAGLLRDALRPLGVERLPAIYGFPGAWFTLTMLSYPYVYLPVQAALRRGDPSLEEAARGLGKSASETFFRVTLPLLRPAVAAGAILVALYVVGEFGAVALLRYDTLTLLVYSQYTTRFDRGYAALLALPLIALAALLVAGDALTRGGARYYSRGQGRPRPRLRLGRWRWPVTALCAVPPTLGLGLPVGVALYWLVSGLRAGESVGFVGGAVATSAQASALAALATVLAALPLAWLSVRFPSWLSGLAERAAYIGHALPGITIALALVFFSATFLTPLYQTVALLIVAYAIRFLPEALSACRSALLQTNPHAEEAARGLGAGSLRVFARITLPQILPGVTAGALLVFLSAMKELPITLLLSPIGSETLATQIWASTTEAFFTRAALPSLLLVLLSGTAVLLMLRGEGREA